MFAIHMQIFFNTSLLIHKDMIKKKVIKILIKI